MSRAGISGMGVISALGSGLESTRKALFGSAEPIPRLPGRFETSLELPVFEIPDPAPAGETGLPVRFLLRALGEALAAAKLTPETLRTMPSVTQMTSIPPARSWSTTDCDAYSSVMMQPLRSRWKLA